MPWGRAWAGWLRLVHLINSVSESIKHTSIVYTVYTLSYWYCIYADVVCEVLNCALPWRSLRSVGGIPGISYLSCIYRQGTHWSHASSADGRKPKRRIGSLNEPWEPTNCPWYMWHLGVVLAGESLAINDSQTSWKKLQREMLERIVYFISLKLIKQDKFQQWESMRGCIIDSIDISFQVYPILFTKTDCVQAACGSSKLYG